MKEVLHSSREEAGEEGNTANQDISILYDFPLFSVSYCGTNSSIEEAFSFVAKDSNDGK